MSILNIDGVDMPDPTTYSFPMADLNGDDSYNEEGTLFRDRIRQGICRIELSWMANAAQAALILDAVAPETVTVSFLDPRAGGYRTAQMCVGDRSCELTSYDGIESQSNLWAISLSLTQY